jgi:site-specific recombinase XerD
LRSKDSRRRRSLGAGSLPTPNAGEERKTSAPRVRHPGQLDAGPFAADIASFRLHLAAENKAAGTIRIYTDAARWFAAAHLLAETGKTRWEQVDAADVRRWVVWLLGRYSEAYAYQQFRSLQQFFRWLAVEEDLPSPMAKLRPPKVTDKPVPFFSSVELSKLGRCCRGNSFEDRRDAAVIAVLLATGIRVSELAAIRCCPGDPGRGDVDLETREIKVRGKGGRDRTVRIGHEAARRLDRYLRAGHELAYRSELWLGVNGRGPLDRSGIYQLVVRRGEECGVRLYPHRFRHHFSHTWLERGGAEGDLMELNGWISPQMLTRYGASARGARARRSYDRVMTGNPK